MKIFQNYWVEIVAILLVVVGICLFWMKKREESIIPLILSLFTFFVGRGIFNEEKVNGNTHTTINETIDDTKQDFSISTVGIVLSKSEPETSQSFTENTKGKPIDEPEEVAPTIIETIPKQDLYPDMSKAINAFDNRYYKEAVNFYKEAANSSPVHSSSILQDASRKFQKKAESFIKNNDGKIDTLSKLLLECAQELNPSREIQELLNKSN